MRWIIISIMNQNEPDKAGDGTARGVAGEDSRPLLGSGQRECRVVGAQGCRGVQARHACLTRIPKDDYIKVMSGREQC